MSFLPPFKPTQQVTTICNVPEGYEALLLSELAVRKGEVIHIASDETKALKIKRQLSFFNPSLDVLWFPGWDCLPYDRTSPHSDVIASRLFTLTQLSSVSLTNTPRVIVTTVNAISQRVPPREIWHGSSRSYKVGQEIDYDGLITFLNHNGYSRRETVREWGEFAVRGGLVDIFPPGMQFPLRLDFFGTVLESVRTFDPVSQITIGKEVSFNLKPMGEVLLNSQTIENFRKGYRKAFEKIDAKDPLYNAISEGRFYNGAEHWLPLFYTHLETLLDYAPKALVSTDAHITEAFQSRYEQIQDHYQTRLDFAVIEKSQQGVPYHPLPPESLYVTAKEWDSCLKPFHKVCFTPFAVPPTSGSVIDAQGKVGQQFAYKKLKTDQNIFEDVKEAIDSLQQQEKRVVIAGVTKGSADRLGQILKGHGVTNLKSYEKFADIIKDPRHIVAITAFEIDHGFLAPGLALISEEDILGERIGKPTKKRRRKDLFIKDISVLEPGDLMVHVEHGIGRYHGLRIIDVDRTLHDCLEVIYDGDDKLLVPVENIETLSRYGSSESSVHLDRLGGSAWQARKAHAKKRIRVIADHLIKIAAERELKSGTIIHKPEGLFDEFLARFPYEETEDQLTAVEDIFSDFSAGKPMDRLICGDVGFGKTEVAMRAAFAMAVSGKQVAIVVPTTLLARQHYHSFQERFAGTGLSVAQLSRLVKSSEAQKVKKRLREGEVNIIIGTHALLAKSIEFQDLGLLIVDEEQHFGVAQKERLKQLKADIHILTLTATPIPRTLQMALAGVREMSLISSPPVDRMAVRTFTLPFDAMVIREAILREQFRGGQTFYVCPRIQDIDKVAERLRKFIPEVKFAIAHGQMPPTILENVMSDFYDGKYDVLLSTNIIESGIDIPRANTIIIHHAHMFGLAQLYQLRGRVGRSKVRGYAYLTLPASHIASAGAIKRLEVMQSLDGLGAGFSIAGHDLDIRGAGNLLGDEQSGHIREVGVELYQQMLEETITSMKADGSDTVDREIDWTPQINLGVSVLIPESYVADLGLRLSLYRRMGAIKDRHETETMAAELIDRFGPLPEEVTNLLEIVYLKAQSRQTGIEKLDAGPKGLVLTLRNNEFSNPMALVQYIQEQAGTAKLRPDQKIVFTRSWEDSKTRLDGVRQIVEKIVELKEEK